MHGSQAYLCLFLFSLFLAMPLHASEDRWSSALASQQEGKFEQAIAEWGEVLKTETEQSTKSSAHWNLGLCCLQVQNTECVAYHWLQSIRSSTSFSHIQKVTAALEKLQNSLGFGQNAVQSSRFLFAANLGAGFQVSAFFLAAWLFIAGILRVGRSKNFPRFPWFIGGSLSLVFALVATYCIAEMGRFHSIGNEGGDISLFKSEKDSTPVAQLPAGTIVLVEEESGQRLRIFSPVPGWIEKSSLTNPLNEMKHSLRGAKHSAAR